MNKSDIVLIGLVILMGLSGAIVGYNIPKEPVVVVQHEVVTETLYVDRIVEIPVLKEVKITEIVEVEKVVEVDRPVEQIIEKIVYVPSDSMTYIPWESMSELRGWLYEYGVADRQYISGEYMCADFAFDLARIAMENNRWIGLYETTTIGGGSLDKHMKAFTPVGSMLIRIEPQTNVLDPYDSYVP